MKSFSAGDGGGDDEDDEGIEDGSWSETTFILIFRMEASSPITPRLH